MHTSRQPWSEKRWLWPAALLALTLIALAMRWYYVSTAMILEPLRGDAQHYHAYAWNLVHHATFAGNLPDSSSVVADSFRDPGYPLLLAAGMKLLGDEYAWYAAVLLFQALLGALTVTLATQLGRRWLPAGWALGAGLLMAVWPSSITMTSNLLTETLFGFLVAVAMLTSAWALDHASPWRALLAGLIFGAAALTNAILLPFGVLLALFLGWRKKMSRTLAVALAIGAMIGPAAWAVRNTQLPVQAGAQSSTDRALMNLVQGSWPLYHAAYRATIFSKDPAAGKRVLREIDAEYQLLRSAPAAGIRAITQRMAQHPWHYAVWYAWEKPRLLWGWGVRMGQGDIYVYPTRNSPFNTQPSLRALTAICYALSPVLIALALCCLVITLVSHWRHQSKPDDDPMLPATLLLLGFVTLVYTALQAEPRYSIPFVAFEVLLAASALRVIVVWVNHRRRQAAEPISS